MEELKEGWRKVKLGDVIDFNPKETLKKNTISKYVEMAQLQCFARNIIGYSFKEYKGGTKFRNGDTLLARITPCLENGKTAFVDILEEDEVGFGSTEYIVLRKKEGYTDENYIFYLAISDLFRQIAIKSMTGTSGRQRVQTEVLKNSEIVIPEVNIQKKIVSILSSLDEKIELNRKINQNLEETAQTLFKRWFIDFEFPNEEGKPYKSSGGKMIESELGEIPEGWRVGKLGDFIKFIKGKKPKILVEKEDGINKFKYLTIKSINNEEENYCSDEKVIFVSKNEIMMVMDGASSGDIYIGKEGVLGSTLSKIEIEKSIDWSIIYCLLNYYKNEIKQHNTGSAIPHTDKNYIENITFFLPNNGKINYFSKIFKRILLKKIVLEDEVYKLIELRDYLLPRLMSGEISV